MSGKNEILAGGRSEAERIEELAAELQRSCGVSRAEMRVVRAPLRICPLGAHIDHQLGPVTGMAIDQSVLFVFAPAADDLVQITSLNFPGTTSLSLHAIAPFAKGDWGNYIRGAALGLQHYLDDRQLPRLARGLRGVVECDMPIGGLSSSAAVTSAYLLALQAVNGIELRPADNVQLVRFTENSYIGLQNGILDQTVILFSRRNMLTSISCRDFSVENLPYPAGAPRYEIVIVYSGITEQLVGTSYNSRVAECREAARQLLHLCGRSVPETPVLGDLTAEEFETHAAQLSPLLLRRAAHFFGEVQRVEAGRDAWSGGNIERFGRLISESGRSSIENYECGSPALIALYSILSGHPDVYGTRFSGAGFRGSCLALVRPGRSTDVARTVHNQYPTLHPENARRYTIHRCASSDGAALLGSASSELRQVA